MRWRRCRYRDGLDGGGKPRFAGICPNDDDSDPEHDYDRLRFEACISACAVLGRIELLYGGANDSRSLLPGSKNPFGCCQDLAPVSPARLIPSAGSPLLMGGQAAHLACRPVRRLRIAGDRRLLDVLGSATR